MTERRPGFCAACGSLVATSPILLQYYFDPKANQPEIVDIKVYHLEQSCLANTWKVEKGVREHNPHWKLVGLGDPTWDDLNLIEIAHEWAPKAERDFEWLKGQFKEYGIVSVAKRTRRAKYDRRSTQSNVDYLRQLKRVLEVNQNSFKQLLVTPLNKLVRLEYYGSASSPEVGFCERDLYERLLRKSRDLFIDVIPKLVEKFGLSFGEAIWEYDKCRASFIEHFKKSDGREPSEKEMCMLFETLIELLITHSRTKSTKVIREDAVKMYQVTPRSAATEGVRV